MFGILPFIIILSHLPDTVPYKLWYLEENEAFTVVNTSFSWWFQELTRPPMAIHLQREKDCLWAEQHTRCCGCSCKSVNHLNVCLTTGTWALPIISVMFKVLAIKCVFNSFTGSWPKCFIPLIFSLIFCTTVKLPLQLPMHHVRHCSNILESKFMKTTK